MNPLHNPSTNSIVMSAPYRRYIKSCGKISRFSSMRLYYRNRHAELVSAPSDFNKPVKSEALDSYPPYGGRNDKKDEYDFRKLTDTGKL